MVKVKIYKGPTGFSWAMFDENHKNLCNSSQSFTTERNLIEDLQGFLREVRQSVDLISYDQPLALMNARKL
jgi:hypothetical protein